MTETTARTEDGGSFRDSIRRVLTFEEARLALILDQRMQELAEGEAAKDVPGTDSGTDEFAELLDVALLLQMRGELRRALV